MSLSEKTQQLWLAWFIILAVTAFLIWVQAGALTPTSSSLEDRARQLQAELRGRLEVGAYLMRQGKSDPPSLLDESGDHEGPYNRLEMAVLTGEMQGPKEALRQLETTDSKPLMQVLSRLYRDYANGRWDAPNLTKEDVRKLKGELGWFGELAIEPAAKGGAARDDIESEARRTAMIMGTGSVVLLILNVMGLFALVRWERNYFKRPSPSRVLHARTHPAHLAETFACWLVLVVLISFVAIVLPSAVRVFVGATATLFALVGLFWLRLRGIESPDIFHDIGLTKGNGVGREIGAGVATYVLSLPLVSVGQALVYFLAQSQDTLDVQSSPVIVFLLDGGPLIQFLMIASICVVAPVVEEIMFRGVLYTQLRRSTSSRPWWKSFVFSAGVSSAIFASIHPQGVLAIPALMAIGFGLACAREIRGSLIAPMTAHAINNGVILLLMLFAMG